MKAPYYIVPDIEEYRKLDPSSEEAKKLSRRIAVNIGDLASLRLVLGIDPPSFARFYPDMETATPSTFDTIDSFLGKFGSKQPPMPSASTIDGYVLSEDEDLLPTEETTEEEKVEDLSDLLKNKKFAEALKFIESQNLNNPQKSIYFAHQIRFIKKLMAIEKYRNKSKG